MHFLHSRNPWSYCLGFNTVVDFCIWALEVDGLHVPPFDLHPDGDGSLRAAGLTAEDWQSWLLRVINRERSWFLRQQAAWPEDLFSILSPEDHHSPSAWNGNAAVR